MEKNRNYWARKRWILMAKARRKGLAFDLTLNDVVILRTDRCMYCDSLNEFMTIDRKDNSIGYLKVNCVTACYLCNSTKGDVLTFEQMLCLGNTIRVIKEENPRFWIYDPNSLKHLISS